MIYSHNKSPQGIILLCILGLFIMCASYSSRYGNKPPERSEFELGQVYSSRVNGSALMVESIIRNFLYEKHWFGNVEIYDPFTYLITWYINEPRSNDPRQRRTAFMIGISQMSSDSMCTEITLSAITSSRGNREETWRIIDEDLNFKSTYEDTIKNLISALGRCER